MTTVAELLSRAKDSIASGMTSWRAATEDMAAANAQGASQRRIAEEVGMSSTWVHQMLKWRSEGYQDATPFGPSSKAIGNEQRLGRRLTRKTRRISPALARTKRRPPQHTPERKPPRLKPPKPKADAAKAAADARCARAEAFRAQAEAAKAEAEARTARARSRNPNKQKVHSGPRDLLVKALGMLGSVHAGEQANAASVVEKQRARLGLTWDELIIPAEEAEAARAA
jgi:hypothetical protein